MELRQLLAAYDPYNEAEARDRELMLYAIDHFPYVLTRENPVCHFTASNWITNPERDKILLVHHNIYMEQQIKKYKYGSDAFMQILESRYSCHAFTHHPVSEAKLGMILDAGRMAPSAANLQPTRIFVVKSEEALARLHQVHPCYGAPVVLVVGCRNEEAWLRPYDGINAAKTDAAIVLTHLMLTATDVGLANMWICPP